MLKRLQDLPQGRALERDLLLRFWRSASGFWTQRTCWRVWLLSGSLISVVAAQLATQYLFNYWNRDFFNALEQKNGELLYQKTLLFFPLVAVSTTLAILSVWGRMTTQRLWRLYLTRRLITTWLRRGRFRLLGHLGTNPPRNPEYRIAEDARIATDAPIDLSLSLVSSIVTVFVFFGILASIGGALEVRLGEFHLSVPAYLGIGVIVYSGLVTAAMLFAGRRFSDVVQAQLQAEAAFRASANLLRESGDGLVATQSERDQRRNLWLGLHEVIERWRRLCGQHLRTTLVSHCNGLLAPIIGLLLCVPKYADGSISLGEVTQAAAAFATVQGALSWLVDNFQRMADWRASAVRVGTLLSALDDLSQTTQPVGSDRKR
jgi:vitamin B12/bleomycin/antimicrobial peptide transport system ATP-binding/permease protein